MYQHQHAPLPLEDLEHIPQPVFVLLEVLLEKDPARRFQNPAELLKAMPTVTSAIDAGRSVTRQSLRETPLATSRAVTREPPTRLGPEKISVARLPVTGSDLFGREEDIAFLDRGWANKDSPVAERHFRLFSVFCIARSSGTLESYDDACPPDENTRS
jgi:hypothetical protein